MKTLVFTLLAAGVAVGLEPAQAQASDRSSMSEISEDVRGAILKIITAEEEAWNAGDAAAFTAPTTPDVIFTNVVGMFSVGQAPFQAQHERIFATLYKGSQLSQSVVHLALVKPDVAIVDTLTEVRGYSHLPPGSAAVDGVLKTRLEQVMVLTDGRWRVAAFHNVPVNPAAAAGPPAR